MRILCRTLKAAIEHQNTLTFSYQDHERVVEPYLYGILNGKYQLHGFQIDGGSNSGGIPQWRNFEMDKIENLKRDVTHTFKPRGTYHPTNANYSTIVEQLNLKK